MLTLLDYIFWRIYRFCRSHWFLDHIPELKAAFTLSMIINTPLICIFSLLIANIPIPWWVKNLFFVILIHLGWLVMSCFFYRYQWDYKVVANNYELFRKKWNREPKKQRKRRKWLIVALFIFTCIICPILTMLTAILLSK